MNKTITLSELARYIAELTHCTPEDAENFVRETFRLTTEKLEAEHESEIPEIGTFVISDNSISFAPEKTLAEELNAPFAAFEAIELPEDFGQCEIKDATAEPSEVNAEQQEPTEAATAEDAPDEEIVEEQEAIAESAEFEEREDAAVVEQPISGTSKRRSHAYVHWIWAAACLLCFALGWFAARYGCWTDYPVESAAIPSVPYSEEGADSVVEEVVADTVETAVVLPQAVTDTISSTRYLTTMARRHYGRMEYWVYIYEANADKLGHPDRLNAGTVVIIPALDFGADDEAKISEAESLAKEIYARFN